MQEPLVMSRTADAAIPVAQPAIPVAQSAAPYRGSTSMFQWKTWQECLAPTGALFPMMRSVISNDRFPAAGETLQAMTQQVGTELYSSTVQRMDANTGGLSYDALLKGFMAVNETTGAPPLDFKSAEMWDYNRKEETHEVYSQGRCIVTNQRLLLMSCEPGSTTKFVPMGEPEKGHQKGVISVSYNARTSVWYHPIPLGNFRSIELLINVGARSEGKIRKTIGDTRCCECFVWACCINSCCPTCCGNEYEGRLTATSHVNDRFVELNFEGAAWQDKKVLRLNISETAQLPEVQRWASCLQASCPKLNGNAVDLNSVTISLPSSSAAQK
jgi:hypothetical protein